MEKVLNVKLLYSNKDKSAYFKMSFGNQPEDIQMMQTFINHIKWLTPDTSSQGWCQVKLSMVPDKDGLSPFDIFFKKGGAYDGLLAKANAKGYPCAKGTDEMINSTREIVKKERDAFNNAKEIDKVTNDLVKEILDTIKNKYNDKQINLFIHNINSININIDPENQKILKTKEISSLNKIKIFAQWRMGGRQGIPKDVATLSQWFSVGRFVNANALPLVITRASEYNNGDNNNLSRYGISFDQMNGVNARSAYRRSMKFTGGNGKFFNYIVYDVSDTSPINQSDSYSNDINYYGVSGEFADKNGVISQETKPLNTGQMTAEEKDVREKLLSYCSKDPVMSDVVNDLKANKDMPHVLMDMFSHVDIIDREKNDNDRADKLNLLVGAALIKLNIETEYGVALIEQVENRVIKAKYNIGDVITSLNDFLNIFNDMNESKRMLNENIPLATEDWLLGIMGITPEEYAKTRQEVAQVEENRKMYKENFDNLWNRIIEANSRNHAVI